VEKAQTMNVDFGVMPKRIWIDMQDDADADACDVIVEMEDESFYTARFVTVPYLHRQMELSYSVSQQFEDVPAVRCCVMETPHILVDQLDRDTIEDTVDNLIALDTFETVFSRVSAGADGNEDGRVRSADVTAVVIAEVLKAEGCTVA
jgi:hypothetical protein